MCKWGGGGGPGARTKAVSNGFPPWAFRSCVYDLCALFNDTELLCQALEAYAQLCQEQKVDVGRWRQETGCREYPRPWCKWGGSSKVPSPPASPNELDYKAGGPRFTSPHLYPPRERDCLKF